MSSLEKEEIVIHQLDWAWDFVVGGFFMDIDDVDNYEMIKEIELDINKFPMVGRILNSKQKNNLSNNCLIWNVSNDKCLEYGIESI